MDNDELFQIVQKINKLTLEAKRSVEVATTALKELEPMLKELLDSTRKDTTQTSLDDFGKSNDIVADRTLSDSDADKNNTLWKKEITLRRKN